jgi:hypothetical protein
MRVVVKELRKNFFGGEQKPDEELGGENHQRSATLHVFVPWHRALGQPGIFGSWFFLESSGGCK